MKIKYSNGKFHGYTNNGFPILVDESKACLFADRSQCLLMIAHDGEQFDFWGGSFEIL